MLFPTLLGIVSRNVDEARRGRATSVVTIVSYLGFLLGPVYVGLWADTIDLRGAMIAVAARPPRFHADSDAAAPLRLHPRVNRTLAIALAAVICGLGVAAIALHRRGCGLPGGLGDRRPGGGLELHRHRPLRLAGAA